MNAPESAIRRARDHPHLMPVPSPDVPGVTRASDVKTKKLQWLWTDRIALGVLNEMIADEGLGKSTLAARIVADATNGLLPGQDGEPIKALAIAEEDGWEHTLAPRLKAAGAAMDRVGFLQVPDGKGGFRSVMLPGDTAFVAEAMAAFGSSLLLIDPTGRHVEVKNSFDPDEIRKALAPLALAAAEGSFAGFSIRHTNRSPGSNARNRSGGSVGYRQTARVQLIFGRDPDDPGNDWVRMLVGSKANNTGRTGGTRIHMSLESVDLDDGNTDDIIVAGFGAQTHHTDTDVLKATNDDDTGVRGRPPTDIVIAEDFIAKTLGNGTRMRATDFLALAEAESIKKRTLERARRSLGVKSMRGNNRLYVYLPPTPPRKPTPPKS